MFTSPEEETKWTVSIVEAIQRTFPNWIPAQDSFTGTLTDNTARYFCFALKDVFLKRFKAI